MFKTIDNKGTVAAPKNQGVYTNLGMLVSRGYLIRVSELKFLWCRFTMTAN